MMRSSSDDFTSSVLFVCMGNICRSPTAEGAFRWLVESAGLAASITIDSAGTHSYHIGEPPDSRAQEAASRRGYDLSKQRGRQVVPEDFKRFDLVLAMDNGNLRALRQVCPIEHAAKLRLFMDFHSNPAVREVPDPYYGGSEGFERVLDLVEEASRGLLQHLRRQGLD